MKASLVRKSIQLSRNQSDRIAWIQAIIENSIRQEDLRRNCVAVFGLGLAYNA
jgi:hypothetical protein